MIKVANDDEGILGLGRVTLNQGQSCMVRLSGVLAHWWHGVGIDDGEVVSEPIDLCSEVRSGERGVVIELVACDGMAREDEESKVIAARVFDGVGIEGFQWFECGEPFCAGFL